MTPEELKTGAITLFGERYILALAKLLGRDRTQIWRYVNGQTPIPELVARVVTIEMAKMRRHGER